MGANEEDQEEEAPETRIEVEIPKINTDLGRQLHFVKLPNFLSVETRLVSYHILLTVTVMMSFIFILASIFYTLSKVLDFILWGLLLAFLIVYMFFSYGHFTLKSSAKWSWTQHMFVAGEICICLRLLATCPVWSHLILTSRWWLPVPAVWV